jgi:Cu/Zn superoxide dismutase
VYCFSQQLSLDPNCPFVLYPSVHCLVPARRVNEQVDHALPSADKITGHAGDLGNLTPDSSGVAKIALSLANLSTWQVLGRGLIIHALEDDGGQPTGNAGARLAQCVLGRTDA